MGPPKKPVRRAPRSLNPALQRRAVEIAGRNPAAILELVHDLHSLTTSGVCLGCMPEVRLRYLLAFIFLTSSRLATFLTTPITALCFPLRERTSTDAILQRFEADHLAFQVSSAKIKIQKAGHGVALRALSVRVVVQTQFLLECSCKTQLNQSANMSTLAVRSQTTDDL